MAKKAEVKQEVKEESPKLFLRNIKVIVKPVKRHRPFFAEGHDGEFMYSGCINRITLPFSISKRSYVDIFESKEEQEFFENALNKAPGALNIFDRNSQFWSKDFFVDLDKDDKELDLSSPVQMLEYKILLANTNLIAPSWGERFKNPGYRWAIVSEAQIEDDSYKIAAKNEEAMELFFSMKNSNKMMYNVLRLIGTNPNKSNENNTTWLKAQIDKIISQKEKVKNVYNIDDFITVAKDPRFNEKIFVLDAIDLGEIKKIDGIYKINESNIPVGRSIDQCVEFFANKKYSEEKILIEQRMELNK